MIRAVFFLRDDGCTERLECGIPKMMIAVKMAVDHPFDRLVGDLSNAIDEVLAVTRVLTRIDDKYAFLRDESDCIRGLKSNKK